MKSIKILVTIIFMISFSILPTQQKGMAATQNMYVHFINVGQGDSIYIKAPNGEDILIDGGRNGNTVVSYLRKQKVKDIEVLISTHPDADHMGGLDEVLKAFKIKSVYAPKVTHTTQVYKKFLTAVKNEHVKIKVAKKGIRIPIKGVSAEFVAPVKTYSQSDTNDWSAVLRLAYGKRSFLFTGDAEFKSETDMMKSRQNLKADVLKVGHHGAKTSTSASFLKAVKPTYAIISVGKGNHYGHPTTETLARLKNAKVKIFRTDKQGSIIAKSNGTTLSFNTRPFSSGLTKSKPSANKLSVVLDNETPKQYSTIHLMVKGLPTGTKYKAVFQYKSKATLYYGKAGHSMPVKISRAAKGYKVVIDITASYKGKSYHTQTAFTPR